MILPYPYDDYKLISNMHKKFCSYFGFNFIDMHEYYIKNNLIEFGRRIDAHHQQVSIMYEFGRNISKTIEYFKYPKFSNIVNDNPKFDICLANDLKILNGNLKEIPMKNSMFNEITYKIEQDTKLQFPNKYLGFKILGVHAWNNTLEWKENFPIPKTFAEGVRIYSSILLQNKNIKFSKESNLMHHTFIEVQRDDFVIDDKSFVRINSKNMNFS